MAAQVWQFSVDAGGTAIVMARLVKLASGQNLVPAVPSDFSSITRTVTALHDDSAISGPTTLNPSNVILATLSTGSAWTKDATGFNFLDVVPGSSFVAEPGSRLLYTFTMTDGSVYYLKANAQISSG
jgi:hypothetical protein